MKQKFVFTVIILATSILVFSACKKDRTTVLVNNHAIVPSSKFPSLKSFYKTLKPETQSFQVDAVKGGTVRGDRGMTFQFAPNSFKDGSGMPVTGKVKITLTEVTTYAEMLGTSARTEAVDGILASAAMFNISATQNGQVLQTANDIKASIPVNTDANLANIQKFEGIAGPEDSSSLDTVVKWKPDPKPFIYNADSTKPVYDSILEEYGIRKIVKFNIETFGWCNLDAYMLSPTGVSVEIKCSGIKDLVNGEVYMKLNQDGLKGLYKLFYLPYNGQFSSAYYYLPEKWNIHIIAIVVDKNNKVYMEDRTITNTGDVHDFSNLKEISDEELEGFFTGLK